MRTSPTPAVGAPDWCKQMANSQALVQVVDAILGADGNDAERARIIEEAADDLEVVGRDYGIDETATAARALRAALDDELTQDEISEFLSAFEPLDERTRQECDF